MAKKDEEIADSQEKLDDIKEIINSTMGAVLSIGANVKQESEENKANFDHLKEGVTATLDELKEMMSIWDLRIKDIEDMRQKQLLASDDELARINGLEKEGVELVGTHLVANLLGTISLVYEIMGKLEIQVSRIESKLSISDQRITETYMEMKVIREQQSHISKELTDLKQESVKLRQQDKKTMLRITYIFTIIFIILASYGGVSLFLQTIRSGT